MPSLDEEEGDVTKDVKDEEAVSGDLDMSDEDDENRSRPNNKVQWRYEI